MGILDRNHCLDGKGRNQFDLSIPARAIEQEPQQLPPEPANDCERVEEPRIYAHGPTPAAAEPAAMLGTYAKADPSTVAVAHRARFYDVTYRGDLRNMIDRVVEIEGTDLFRRSD